MLQYKICNIINNIPVANVILFDSVYQYYFN
jgi:hypothetical protein